MKLRLLAVLALVVGLTGAVALTTQRASAAPAAPTPSAATTTVPCTAIGTLTPTTCTVTVTGFQVINGVVNAVGTVTNNLTGAVANFTTPVLNPAGSCQVLDLTVGAINLNLLGLNVATNTIHLNITAVPGPGNLLGNLLCAVTHLLDNPNGLTGLLNNLLRHGLLGLTV